MEVYLHEVNLFGEWLYMVMVDGVCYDKFFCKGFSLTFADQRDVASYYKEALEQQGDK